MLNNFIYNSIATSAPTATAMLGVGLICCPDVTSLVVTKAPITTSILIGGGALYFANTLYKNLISIHTQKMTSPLLHPQNVNPQALSFLSLPLELINVIASYSSRQDAIQLTSTCSSLFKQRFTTLNQLQELHFLKAPHN